MTVLYENRKLTNSCLLCEAFDGKCTNKASVNYITLNFILIAVHKLVPKKICSSIPSKFVK